MSDPGRILLELRSWSLVRETADGPETLLQDLDLTVHRGQWLAVLGANGSGKTSLLHFLAGEDSPLSARRALVFQDPDAGIVGATVAEELALGRPGLPVAEVLAAYGLTELAGLSPRLLSAGQKQRLAVAVAEAGDPEVLLCDEPTALQDGRQAAWLLARLQSWRRRTGGTVLFATQRREEVELADRVILLADGRLVAEGPPAEILSRPDVAELLAGDPEPAPRPPVALGSEPVVEWEDVGFRFDGGPTLFAGVNLTVRPGQRIGLTGPNGCGKSTLLALAAGLLPTTTGCCRLAGRRLCARRRADLDHGVALLAPQFPEYFFTRTTVAAEVALDPAVAAHGVEPLLAAAGLPAALAGRNPYELSSGQRRRLAVAMVVLSGRPLLLLDEPTAALDRRGRRRLLRLLAKVPPETALVLAAHDTDFLAACGCETHVLGPGGLQPAS